MSSYERLVQLGRTCVLEPAQCTATIVQADPMWKFGPGKGIDFLDVVQKFDQFEGSRTDFLDLVGLLDGVEIVSYIVDATAGRCDDVIEAGEVAHEQRLSGGGFVVEPAIYHRLAAAGLVARVVDVVAEPLEQFDLGSRSRDTRFDSMAKISGLQKADSGRVPKPRQLPKQVLRPRGLA